MGEEKQARDYKGWLSLVIGACAVWVAYESLNFQKSQTEADDPTGASPENTIGPANSNEGQHSYQESAGSSTSSEEKVDKSEPSPPLDKQDKPSDKHEKGSKDKKNK